MSQSSRTLVASIVAAAVALTAVVAAALALEPGQALTPAPIDVDDLPEPSSLVPTTVVALGGSVVPLPT